jgi:hypothetical protein
MSRTAFEVQARPCDSCIYRRDSGLNITHLEAQIADPRMAGFFTGYRACHHAPDRRGVCCRGFWDRHKDQFTLGQLAQRLGWVVFVTVDRFTKKGSKAHGKEVDHVRP